MHRTYHGADNLYLSKSMRRGQLIAAARRGDTCGLGSGLGTFGRYAFGGMSRVFSEAGVEFLQHYQCDVSARWSAQDLAAQQEFVNARIAGRHWLDWSSPSAALQLVQAFQARTAVGVAEKYEVIVLAGPVVELLDPSLLFGQAARGVTPGGTLVGIIPCLRDNSPESREFMREAAASLWPYYAAEELFELLGEAGWQVDPEAGGYVPIPQFNAAVLSGRLGFKGFGRVFDQLRAQGYDPMEVGWGEVRFGARLDPNVA